MYVEIDLSAVPPTAELRDADDFSDFRVIASVPSHVWLAPDVLAELAGRSEDGEWHQRLAGMVAYAAEKGWVDERGRVRAHVQIEHD